MDLGPIKAQRLNGTEEFHNAGTSLGFNVADFWGWSVSDLVSNASRGILAEYIVGRAVGADCLARRPGKKPAFHYTGVSQTFFFGDGLSGSSRKG